MIDFEEEIRRFSPAKETSEAEELIRNHDVTDVSDILRQMVEDMKMQQPVASNQQVQGENE